MIRARSPAVSLIVTHAQPRLLVAFEDLTSHEMQQLRRQPLLDCQTL